MMEKNAKHSRRNFMGTVAAGAATGLSLMTNPLEAIAPTDKKLVHEADEWFKKVKGKHRIVFDCSETHNGFAIIWTWAYYLTNNQTDTPDSDMTGVCVLRHGGIPFAMNDSLWKKYKFGEMFKVNDNSTGKPSLRNPYYEPKEGDFPMPAINGIKKMQERGALFCVCDLALTVYSGAAAKAMGLDPAETKKEWLNGVLPGIQVVPSGVWALGRAQENGCGYIYAGG